jgi:hypothetical protein
MIKVLTGAYTTDPDQWRHFRDSAVRHKVDLKVFGEGQPYPGLPAYRDVLAYLDTLTHPYVMITDAYDVAIVRWSEAEIAARIEASPGKILMSCEENCWPAGPWCEAYRQRKDPRLGRWGYINGGQYCGRLVEVIQLIRELIKPEWNIQAGGGSQEIFHQIYAAGWPMDLDADSEIFQSMAGESSKFVMRGEGGVFNMQTLSWPMLLHFNGRTPGIEKWV